MDRLLNNSSLTPFFQESVFEGSWVPMVDVCDTKDKVLIRAELPGLKKEDIEVNVYDNSLTIKGEKKMSTEARDEDYVRRESYPGTFSRSFTLPADVDATNVKANFKDGILELALPKKPEVQQKHHKV